MEAAPLGRVLNACGEKREAGKLKRGKLGSWEDKKLGKNKKKRNKNLCNLCNLWTNLFIIRVNSWKFVGKK